MPSRHIPIHDMARRLIIPSSFLPVTTARLLLPLDLRFVNLRAWNLRLVELVDIRRVRTAMPVQHEGLAAEQRIGHLLKPPSGPRREADETARQSAGQLP